MSQNFTQMILLRFVVVLGCLVLRTLAWACTGYSTSVRSKCYLNCNCNLIWPVCGWLLCLSVRQTICRSLSKRYSIINNFSFIISQLNNIFWWYTLISTYTYIYSVFLFSLYFFCFLLSLVSWIFLLFCKVLYIYGNYCGCVLLLLRMQMLQQTLLITFN